MNKFAIPALLLSASVTADSFNAMDTRALSMGGTGVANASAGSAALFNPALLSQNGGEHSVHLVFPHIMANLKTDKEAFDAYEDIEDAAYISDISVAVNNYNNGSPDSLSQLAAATVGLNRQLGKLSDQPLHFYANGLFSITRPNKTLGFSMIANSTAVLEGLPMISACDQALLDDYASLAYTLAQGDVPSTPIESNCINNDGQAQSRVIFKGNQFVDPDNAEYFTSKATVAAVIIGELGIAMAHETLVFGHAVSVGITPKWMTIQSAVIDPTLSDIEDSNYDVVDALKDSKKSDADFNIDVGLVTRVFDDAVTVGLSIKNIFEKTYKTQRLIGDRYLAFDIKPQARAGIAWTLPAGFTLASDIDLTKNSPYFNGYNTQYLGAGFEWDMLKGFSLRGGVKKNLANSNDYAATAGLGLNITSVHIDVGGQYSSNNIGLALQLGLTF